MILNGNQILHIAVFYILITPIIILFNGGAIALVIDTIKEALK